MEQPTVRSTPSVLLNRELTSRLLEAIGGQFSERNLAAFRMVMPAGSLVEYLPIVRSGRLQVALLLGAEADKVIPISFGPGETAMTSSLFSSAPLAGDLVAVESSVIHVIPKELLEKVISARGDLSLLLAKFLVARLQEVQDRERGYLARSVHVRVAAALERARSASNEAGVIQMTHEQLAAWAGVSRPKVSLALKRMERLGHVRLNRGSIEMCAPPSELR